jgi:hypothetical protein
MQDPGTLVGDSFMLGAMACADENKMSWSRICFYACLPKLPISGRWSNFKQLEK